MTGARSLLGEGSHINLPVALLIVLQVYLNALNAGLVYGLTQW
ncbi:MAG: hypothetical protein OJF47_003571 [Nitrospira sp.]|nr:MAG: hypothetical protein OJF47_003571 [Nitrospira sp.]